MKFTYKSPLLALALVGAIGLSTLAVVRAQNQSLADALGLNKAQRTKMEAIEKKYQPKAAAIMKKYEPQIVPIRQQVQVLEKKYKPRLSAIQAEFAKEAKPLQDKAVAIQNQANKELQPIQAARQKELEAVLTPAQREKVKKIDAARLKMLQAQQAKMKKTP
jgi:1-deoxy-D-xylulose 5-phosphate reductoisomerase